MKIKKETFDEYYDCFTWYSKGYDRNGRLIWRLDFHSVSNILNDRTYKSFTTYRYDDKGNLIKKFVEEADWDDELRWNCNLWKLNSIIKYEYIEHKFGDQLKVKETEFNVENCSPRTIHIHDCNIIIPKPLYPDESEYELKGKRKEIEIEWAGNRLEKYIKTTSFSQVGEIIEVHEKIHSQDELDVLITYQLNNDIYSEKKELHEDTMSSIILIEEDNWSQEKNLHRSFRKKYEYDREDKLIETVQEKKYFDIEEDYELIERNKKITIKYSKEKPILKKEESFYAPTLIKDYGYNDDGQIISYRETKYNNGFGEKKLEVSIKYKLKKTILSLDIYDPKDRIEFNLNHFINLPNLLYELDIFTENEEIEYLESNRLDITIRYEYDFISEIVLSDNKTGRVIKKNLFLNHFIYDKDGKPFIKSITGLFVEPNCDTEIIFRKTFEYFTG